MRAARSAIFTGKINRRGIHRGGSMRDGRARRGKMVQGRRGVRSFSALVHSPVRTPRCPRPRVSYRCDVLGCNLVRCLRCSSVDNTLPPRLSGRYYLRGLFGGAAGVERTGRRRQVWATARATAGCCNVPGPADEPERPSPCPQLRPSRRGSPASRLSLEPAPFASCTLVRVM